MNTAPAMAALLLAGLAAAGPAAAGLAAAGLAAPQQGGPAGPPPAMSGAARPLAPPAPRQMVAVVHVHTDASSGSEAPSSLSAMAREAGVDLLVLTENFGYQFRYAPWPLRYFFEARRSTPTLEDHGIDRYLGEIAELQRREPQPAILIGVEVPAYYYWTGSLLTGDLTLHDMQRNVLVFAPLAPAGGSGGDGGVGGDREDAEGRVPGFAYDVAATADLLRSIPAVGNRYYRHYGAGSLLLLAPGLVALAWALSRLHRRGAFRPATYRQRFRPSQDPKGYMRSPPVHHEAGYWAAVVALAAAIALLTVNFPYAVRSLSPYDAGAGYRPFQRLFQAVADGGGLSFWSMPEASDHHEIGVGPLAVKLSTTPYPEALTETAGYTGFGGVYADTITTIDAGGPWDRAIAAHLVGERNSPPYLIGESAFHFTGQAGKHLDDVLTLLLVDEPGIRAGYEALAAGRSYAVRREPAGPDLRLRELAAVGADEPQGLAARAGQTLRILGDRLELVLQVEDAAGAAVAVEITVIRDGAVHRRWNAATPVAERWLETLEPGDRPAYFRVIVRGPRPAYVVSNPIFVRPGGR